MKQCPFCNEWNIDEVIQCRNCHEWLELEPTPRTRKTAKTSKKGATKSKPVSWQKNLQNIWAKYAGYIGIALAIIIIGVIFIYQKSGTNKNADQIPNVKVPQAVPTPTLVRGSEPDNVSLDTPNNANAVVEWNNKALSLWADGKFTDPDKAVEYLTNAIKLQPSYSKSYYNRGIAYSNLGDSQRAIEDYTKAIELKADHFRSYYNRGTIYLKLGKNDLACPDLQKACESGLCDQLEISKANGTCR